MFTGLLKGASATFISTSVFSALRVLLINGVAFNSLLDWYSAPVSVDTMNFRISACDIFSPAGVVSLS